MSLNVDLDSEYTVTNTANITTSTNKLYNSKRDNTLNKNYTNLFSHQVPPRGSSHLQSILELLKR